MKLLQGPAGFILKVGVSLSLITFLLWHIDLNLAWGKIAGMPFEWLAAACTAMLLQCAVAAARWSRLCAATGLDLPFPIALRYLFVGMFFNQTLPSSVGGDVARIIMIQRMGISLGQAVSNVLLDRIFGLLGLVLIAAAGLSTVYNLINPSVALGLSAVVGLLLAAIAMFSMLGGALGIYLARIRFLAPFHRTGCDMRRVLSSPGAASVVIGYSLLSHVLMILMFWALAEGLGIGVPIMTIAALIPLSIVATMAPISIAGWGVREGAIVVLLGLVGVAAESALVLSLLAGIIITAMGLPGGLLWLGNRKLAGEEKLTGTSIGVK